MSFQSMYNQYINRTLKSECDWKKNQKNPGRCKAAQQYAKEMRKFVDKAVKSSVEVLVPVAKPAISSINPALLYSLVDNEDL